MQTINPYIFSLSIIIGLILMIIYTHKTKNMMFVVKGYHFHHSMYCVISFLIALLLYIFKISIPLQIFFIGLGIGIIIQHTFMEKFCFIEKTKKYKNKTGIIKK